MEPILEIVKIGDEVLREKCAPVKEFDSSLKMLTEAMFDELLEADGVGLAAPQIGENYRVFVIDVSTGNEPLHPIVFINPKIIKKSIFIFIANHYNQILEQSLFQKYAHQKYLNLTKELFRQNMCLDQYKSFEFQSNKMLHTQKEFQAFRQAY